MTRFVFRLSAIVVASLGLAGAVFAAEPFDAFLEKHCISCHGPKKEKGDLRIDQLSRDFKLVADAHAFNAVGNQRPPRSCRSWATRFCAS